MLRHLTQDNSWEYMTILRRVSAVAFFLCAVDAAGTNTDRAAAHR
jgi:hypothetical protein